MTLTDATPLAIAGFASIAVSLAFLVIGIQKAKARQLKQHKFFMLAATSTNTIFLLLYFTRLAIEGSTEFVGADLIFRLVYLPILTVHIIFALVSIYFVARQINMGIKHASPKIILTSDKTISLSKSCKGERK